ncbi:MAG: hypothetical protein J6Y20_03725 [Lachnospiraceae bacterium]|nr:hypothetical protein [Lachnospiraceae bacterium]
MKDYKALVKRLRSEADCYPDECEYCSGEGKCRCQLIGQACDAIEELLPFVDQYNNLTELMARALMPGVKS